MVLRSPYNFKLMVTINLKSLSTAPVCPFPNFVMCRGILHLHRHYYFKYVMVLSVSQFMSSIMSLKRATYFQPINPNVFLTGFKKRNFLNSSVPMLFLLWLLPHNYVFIIQLEFFFGMGIPPGQSQVNFIKIRPRVEEIYMKTPQNRTGNP